MESWGSKLQKGVVLFCCSILDPQYIFPPESEGVRKDKQGGCERTSRGHKDSLKVYAVCQRARTNFLQYTFNTADLGSRWSFVLCLLSILLSIHPLPWVCIILRAASHCSFSPCSVLKISSSVLLAQVENQHMDHGFPHFTSINEGLWGFMVEILPFPMWLRCRSAILGEIDKKHPRWLAKSHWFFKMLLISYFINSNEAFCRCSSWRSEGSYVQIGLYVADQSLCRGVIKLAS